jgi:sn-glycerol 3-phosphate transport system permease protein
MTERARRDKQRAMPHADLLRTAGAIPAADRTRRMRAARRRPRVPAGWLMLAPSLLFLALFTYWPVLLVLRDAVTVRALGRAPRWGLDNFARLFADPHFAQAASNNAVYAVATIAPSLLLALVFALGLRQAGPLAGLLRTLFALPLLIPLVAAAALFTFILLPGAGLLDHYLARLGAPETNWLGDPDLALGAIVAITVWKNTGYYMLFFLAGLAGVPRELTDAAAIDGAGAWSRLRHVTLPLLGPTIAFVLVIAALNALTQVDHVVVMTQGGPSNATSLLLFYIYQQAAQNQDIGLAAAATVVSVGVLFALATTSLRTLERGIHHAS